MLKTLDGNLQPVTAYALAMTILELHDDKAEQAKMSKAVKAFLRLSSLRFKGQKNQFVKKYSTKVIALGCLRAACEMTGSNRKILSRIAHLVGDGVLIEVDKIQLTLLERYDVVRRSELKTCRNYLLS